MDIDSGQHGSYWGRRRAPSERASYPLACLHLRYSQAGQLYLAPPSIARSVGARRVKPSVCLFAPRASGSLASGPCREPGRPYGSLRRS